MIHVMFCLQMCDKRCEKVFFFLFLPILLFVRPTPLQLATIYGIYWRGVAAVLVPSLSYPGSEFFSSRIPDLGSKTCYLSSRKCDPGCSFRIAVPDFFPSRTQGSEKQRIPRFRIRNTAFQIALLFLRAEIFEQ